HGNEAAIAAVDDGNRATPVPLARKAPVAETEADSGSPPAARGQPVDDRARTLGRRPAAELARVDEPLVVGVCHERPLLAGTAPGRLHDRDDGQPERAGES